MRLHIQKSMSQWDVSSSETPEEAIGSGLVCVALQSGASPSDERGFVSVTNSILTYVITSETDIRVRIRA